MSLVHEMAVPSLVQRAEAILRQNDTGIFVKPGLQQYPHQWNWDTAFVVFGLSHLDSRRARAEVLALLEGQWRDGMVPHVVYHGGASDYFPTPAFWQIESSANAPAVPTSGITQPPILATAVRLLHARSRDREASLAFVRTVYPSLLAWHRWLYSARDPQRSGLVAIVHPWESGTDNATRWAEPMARITPHDLPAYRRGDAVHVAAAERPLAEDYERYIYLVDTFRRRAYDPAALYADSPFLVQDVFFNALLQRANEDLRALAQALGEPTSEVDGWIARTGHAFDRRFWHDEDGLYYDYDLRAGAPIRDNTCAAFMPLFAGLPGADEARRLVEEQLMNPLTYAPDERTRYYLPSVAKNSPLWEPRRYWRGPIWIPVNWLLIHGLRRYDYEELASEIGRQTLALISQSGFFEYYDPRDGSGCGAPEFSWTAALAIDLLLDDEHNAVLHETNSATCPK
jgi:glycogen debranching enzyme